MTYKFTKRADKPVKDLRLSIPGEQWESLDAHAKAEGVDAAEIIRDMIAYCLKSSRSGRKRKNELAEQG